MSIKNLFFTLCAVILLASACKKDEECTVLQDTIIGTWTSSLGSGDIEFESDGTLIDPNDNLVGAEINGVVFDEKSWTVSNDSLHVRAENGSQFVSSSVNVTSFECDVINLEFIGIDFNLSRK